MDMQTLLDRLGDYVPEDLSSIGFAHFAPALVPHADPAAVVPEHVAITNDERDVLVTQLRVVRDALRRTASCGAVAWIDIAIVQLTVDRWRVEAEEHPRATR
jgi:hypothetical protein